MDKPFCAFSIDKANSFKTCKNQINFDGFSCGKIKYSRLYAVIMNGKIVNEQWLFVKLVFVMFISKPLMCRKMSAELKMFNVLLAKLQC